MIYWLGQWMLPYISAFNVFTYVSSRSVFAALTSLFIGLLIGPLFIKKMRNAGYKQPIRDDGPESHLEKEKTPTMGGLLIGLSLGGSLLLWGDLSSLYLWVLVGVFILFAGIGAIDDTQKLLRKNSKGLSAKSKLLLQSLSALAVLTFIWQADLIMGETGITIPYMKEQILPLGIVGFFIIGYLAIVGASNAVNLTDGLDGLAILPAVMICGGMGVYAYVVGHSVFSVYLGLPYIAGAHELVVFCAAFIGSGLAFLWFNAHPAQIFMGDVGSLAIGAVLAVIAIIVRQELIFIIMSVVFIAEALSVMLQVGSYKATGRRLFRMAPIHHHFELKGWKESQVVVRFWIITIVFVLIGLSGLKIR